MNAFPMPKRRSTKKDPDALTPLEEGFSVEYIIDKNGTEALRRAGSRGNDAALRSMASRMLAKANVWARIKWLMDKVAERRVLTAQQVLARLSDIAEVDVNLIRNENGTFKPISEWPAGYGKLIIGIESAQQFDGETATIARIDKVKVEAKVPALVALARHHKLLTDRTEVTVNHTFSERLRKAREKRLKG